MLRPEDMAYINELKDEIVKLEERLTRYAAVVEAAKQFYDYRSWENEKALKDSLAAVEPHAKPPDEFPSKWQDSYDM